jgi:hypothetical protein
MNNYSLTFYANAIDGCVKCFPDELPAGGNWINSSDPEDVLFILEDCGNETLFFKVTPDVYEAVLETYNIYN